MGHAKSLWAKRRALWFKSLFAKAAAVDRVFPDFVVEDPLVELSRRAGLARLPRVVFKASWIKSFSYAATVSASTTLGTVPEDSAVCSVGGR